jgi:hypothetical protein
LLIALIGVFGALAGTVVGGLVTWKVTDIQISAQRHDQQLAERRDAYAAYLGDAASFWLQAQVDAKTLVAALPLGAKEKASLDTVEGTLTRENALVALLAPAVVRKAAALLNTIDTNALDGLMYSNLAEYFAAFASHKTALDNFNRVADQDLGINNG